MTDTLSMEQATMNNLLVEAVDSRDLEHAKAYVAKGANVNVGIQQVRESIRNGPSNYGNAPLYHYMIANHWDVAMSDFLLSEGVPVDVKNFNGNTPLMLAVKNGDTTKVAYFLKNGANPLETNNAGEMVLQQAQKLPHDMDGRQKIIDALVEKLADATQKGHVAGVAAAFGSAAAQKPAEDLSTHQEIKPLKTVTFGGPQKPKADFQL